MQWWEWLLISLGVFLAIYASFLAWLVAAGRREDARALATFIPDCIVLVTRLARDSRVPRRRKFLLLGLGGYLALPFRVAPSLRVQAARRRRRSAPPGAPGCASSRRSSADRPCGRTAPA